MTDKVTIDRGPWEACVEHGKYFVQSDDFKHDVRLYIDGDFEDKEQKAAYCFWLAATLNSDAITTNILKNIKDTVPEYERLIDKHFWDLLDD